MTKKILKEYAEWVRENNLYKDFMIGLAVALSFFALQQYHEINGSLLVQLITGTFTLIFILVCFFYYNYPTLLRSIVSSWERRREKIEGGYTLQRK